MSNRKLKRVFFTIVILSGFCLTSQASVILNLRKDVTGTESIDGTATDYIIYNADGSDTDISKDGGPGMFQQPTTDGSVQATTNEGFPITLEWSNGTPDASGSTDDYVYAGFGSGFSSSASYLDMQLTMPGTSGTLTIWTRPNGNTGNIDFDVSMGKTGNIFTDSYSDSTSPAEGWVFEFELTEFQVNDTVNFRVDNVSGSNNYHNFGIYGAEFIVPEPASGTILGLIAIGFLATRPRRGNKTI